MNVILCFLPVTLFLVFLFLLDSFNLVRYRTLVLCLLWGTFCATACYFLNTLTAKLLRLDYQTLSYYEAPVIEESMKAIFLFYLVFKKRIGFMIDAAIYGFAIGAGFSLVENITLLFTSDTGYNFIVMVIRGLGTGLMHGGCTSFFAVLLVGAVNRSGNKITITMLGLLLAIFLHSGFNHFPFNPFLQTLMMILVLPAVFVLVFRLSNSRLQKWLEIEFSSEIGMLNMIRKGEFGSTNSGQYLRSISKQFAPEIVVDMYCYIELYLELSIKAKRNLMLKENGFPVITEDDMQAKLKELEQVRKNIGKVGELALSPLIRMTYRNLWKLNQLL